VFGCVPRHCTVFTAAMPLENVPAVPPKCETLTS
jgi:hypothetical protein